MKRMLHCIIFVLSIQSLSAQNIDTLALKNEVLNLKSFQSKMNFLEKLYAEDQQFRGANSNPNLDFEHLISISYFINEFGYPKKSDFGRASACAWLTWIHNSNRELKKNTFPIILQGFTQGEIQQLDLREYYLRGLYHYKFDDNNIKNMPLKELFQKCEVNLDDKISIEEIIKIRSENEKFNELKIINEATWKANNKIKYYDLNGEQIKTTIKGEVIKIMEKEDGKIYLLKVYDDGSGEPIELEKLSANSYKYKACQTEKYFEFSEEKIVFKDQNEIFKEYSRFEK